MLSEERESFRVRSRNILRFAFSPFELKSGGEEGVTLHGGKVALDL
jgi:hypothetical protein